MVYYLWGYHPNSHNMIYKWYPPQFNSPLGFINPGLTLQKLGVQKPSEQRLTQILQPANRGRETSSAKSLQTSTYSTRHRHLKQKSQQCGSIGWSYCLVAGQVHKKRFPLKGNTHNCIDVNGGNMHTLVTRPCHVKNNHSLMVIKYFWAMDINHFSLFRLP